MRKTLVALFTGRKPTVDDGTSGVDAAATGVAGSRGLLVVHGLSQAALGMSVPMLPMFLSELGVADGAPLALWSALAFGGGVAASVVATPLWGLLGDRVGRWPMVLRACLGLALAQLALILAPTALWVVVARVLQGCISGIQPAVYALGGALFHEADHRAKASRGASGAGASGSPGVDGSDDSPDDRPSEEGLPGIGAFMGRLEAVGALGAVIGVLVASAAVSALGGFRIVYGVALGCSCAAMLVTLFIRRDHIHPAVGAGGMASSVAGGHPTLGTQPMASDVAAEVREGGGSVGQDGGSAAGAGGEERVAPGGLRGALQQLWHVATTRQVRPALAVFVVICAVDAALELLYPVLIVELTPSDAIRATATALVEVVGEGAYFLAAPVLGRIMDRRGLVPVLGTSLVVAGTANMMAPLMRSPFQLLPIVGGAEVASAGVYPVIYGHLARAVTAQHVGASVSLGGTVSRLGGALGTLLVGPLVALAGLAGSFVVLGATAWALGGYVWWLGPKVLGNGASGGKGGGCS